jgi:2-dehydro-3-deoxygluconokinase
MTDLLAIGETMLLVAPVDGAPLALDATCTISPGGAESNVAIALAALGRRTAWLSRLGSDRIGDLVLEGVGRHGVDVSLVERDDRRPTAVYFKQPGPGGTTVAYYRAGSAASAMSPAFALTVAATVRPRIVHLSGITAALSPECGALLDAVLDDRPFGDATVVLDVNFRPALWPDAALAAIRLLDLARRADVVLVGRDEAERLWDTRTAEDVRALLPEVPHLVVKDGDVEAVEFTLADGGVDASATRETGEGIGAAASVARVAARRIDVVEPVGAGDAFAAGWLAGLLAGHDATRRLELGHEVAAAVLVSHTDQAQDLSAAIALLERGAAPVAARAADDPAAIPSNGATA